MQVGGRGPIDLHGQKWFVEGLLSVQRRQGEHQILPYAGRQYRELMDNTPQLMGLVTQIDISRYLGVTPVGLSRIKRRAIEAARAYNPHQVASLSVK